MNQYQHILILSLSDFINSPSNSTPLKAHKQKKLLPTQSTPNSNSIIGYFQPKVSIFDKRQLDYDFDILELIVDCSLSFNIVESAGFKKFAAKREPRMTVKSATTFSR